MGDMLAQSATSSLLGGDWDLLRTLRMGAIGAITSPIGHYWHERANDLLKSTSVHP